MAINTFNFLKPIDMHTFHREVRKLLGFRSCAFGVLGNHKEIHMRFVNALAEFTVIKSAMNKIEFHLLTKIRTRIAECLRDHRQL